MQKVAVKQESNAGFHHARTGKLSLTTSSKWVPFSNEGRIRQRKEMDELHLPSAVPKIQWDSNPTAPMAIRVLGKPFMLPFTVQ